MMPASEYFLAQFTSVAAVLALAAAQPQPQLTTSSAGDITAVATDLVLSPPGSGASVSLNGVASSMAVIGTNLSALSTAVETGQGLLQGRVNSIDLALQSDRLARDALNASIQSLISAVAALDARLATVSNELSALASVTNPPSCPLSAMSGWQASGTFTGQAARPSATSAAGSSVPVGGSVVFTPSSGFFLPGGASAVTVACHANGNSATGAWSGGAPTASPCLTGCATCRDATTCVACVAGRSIAFVPTRGFPRVRLTGSEVTFDPIGLSINGRAGSALTPAVLLSGARFLTDGTPNAAAYRLGPNYGPRACANPAWIQIDLGANMRIGSVSVWHYYLDTRTYCGQRIAISTTGQFTGEEVEIHNPGLTPHLETPDGITVPANGTVGRYVRHWAAGSDRNVYVHFVEFGVTATTLNAPHTIQCV